MWVRHQNGKALANYNGFSITKDGGILGFQGPDDAEGALLGVYENEDRALKVVDCIQHKITNSLREDYIEKGVRHTAETVFIMPNE